ncbi:MAG: ABC transporter substrate-binding protein [Rhodospirillaceae bacterium]|nr:ABC transporter substrate-binding protein [Rhodospirillaceae bacterium]
MYRGHPSFGLRRGALATVFAVVLAVGTSIPAPFAVAQDNSKTLRVAITGYPPAGGNPFPSGAWPAAYTFTAIFDALTFVALDGKIEAQLATHWQQVAPKIWRFFLRKNVIFSNGEPFDAEAALFTFKYVLSPEAAATNARLELSSLVAARALDEHTIELETREPNLFLDRELSTLRFVAPRHWSTLGPAQFARAPVGTGPFQVNRWTESKILLDAFDGSWRAPKTQKLELLNVTDMTGRLQALLSNRADIALTISPQDEQLLLSADMSLYPGIHSSVLTLAFVTEKPGPLRDRRVRLALNHAVDKQRLTKAFLNGVVDPSTQFAVPGAFGYDPTLAPYAYDPALAKRLLEEAGYPAGFSFVMEGALAGGTNSATIHQQVASDLAQIGVRMEVRSIPIQQLSRNIHQFDWRGHAFEMNYGAAPAMDALIALRMHSCAWKAPWYCDRDIMPMIEDSMNARTLADRETRTRAVMRRTHAQAPGLLLFPIVWFVGLGPHVEGFVMDGGHIKYDRISVTR